MTPTPGTYRYARIGILATVNLVYVVKVSSSATVYCHRIKHMANGTARWGPRSCCKFVDVLTELPSFEEINRTITLAGQPPEVAA